VWAFDSGCSDGFLAIFCGLDSIPTVQEIVPVQVERVQVVIDQQNQGRHGNLNYRLVAPDESNVQHFFPIREPDEKARTAGTGIVNGGCR
jgi:hypothetical protein